jgi:hypothetical protein
MMILVIPLLIFTVILNIFVGISEGFSDEAATKKVKIRLVETASTVFKKGINNSPKSRGENEILIFKDATALGNPLQSDSTDFGVFICANFEKLDKENG